MSSLSNRIQLIGNLGVDPETKSLPSGGMVCNFTLATEEKYTRDGEVVSMVEWHRLVAYEKVAETVGKLLKKGHRAAFEGRITYRSYEDNEGATRYVTEVVVTKFLKLTPKDAV